MDNRETSDPRVRVKGEQPSGKVITTDSSDNGGYQALTEEGITPRAGDKKAILRERALRLAKPPEEDDRTRQFLEVIEFILAHERYAVEVAFVREVYPFKDITIIPCVPSFVLGVINIRGQILSVTDIRQFFDLPRKETADQAKVLILANQEMELGILVDSVVGERKIPLNEIQSDIASLGGLRENYIRGVTKDRLVVMNVDKFLSDDAIVVHQEVGD